MATRPDIRMPERERIDLHIHLPTRTVVKVLLTLIAAWAGLRLWPEFVLLLISLLVAVALHPVVTRLERRGLGRGTIVGVMTLIMCGVLALLITVVFTSLAEQLAKLVQDFPALRDRVDQRLPAHYPTLKRIVREIFALPSSPEVAAQLKRPLALGTVALSGVVSMFFMLVVTIYLLLDGKRLYAWLIAYIPRVHRDRMATTAEEVSQVVYAYVRGQAIASALFTVFTGIVLSVLGVPAVVPLAILAGLCDVIPVVGVILATVPAVLLALTVSPATAGIVLVCYVGYHVFETYFLVPRIYGAAPAPVDAGRAAGAARGPHAAGPDRRRAGAAAGGGLPDHRAHLAGELPVARGRQGPQRASQVRRGHA